MGPNSSNDMLGPSPRKDKKKATDEATAKTPDKTNDWDRDAVHGDGDEVGIASHSDAPAE
ncbi:hypothetical protein EOA36_11310 [Mesorhizobium sp. M8A.F.Ca.ET.021.01.1.1]|nr:hypothetical protein EOA36_11310 [Mesorhizobium sp. M8A.F.Ca.ET.021.01.1.1]